MTSPIEQEYLSPGALLPTDRKVPSCTGNFDIPPAAVMKVAASSDPQKLAMALRSKIKEHGVCVLESFGRIPVVTSLQVSGHASARLCSSGMKTVCACWKAAGASRP